jgi:hypothetical protein
VCREFVRGTESGHCPRCGLAAPTIEVLRTERTGRSTLVVVALVGLLVLWILTRN